MTYESERPRAGQSMSREVEYLLRADVEALKARVAGLTESLAFYADPMTYFGIGIFPDRPCGEFAEDFSEVPWPDGGTNYKPGKRAREALAEEVMPGE